MSRRNESERFRLHLAPIESPTFTNLQLQAAMTGLSPVTNLAMNLSEASILSTPRRRLSLSSVEDTPSPCAMKIKQTETDVQMESPLVGNRRLLKNAISLPSSNSNQNFSRVRGFSRRINLNSHASVRTPLNNKENEGSASPAIDDLPSIPFLSPTKQISPSKFAGTRHTPSPLRPRQPLEDHDPNSQDSGYGTVLPDKEDVKNGFRFTEPLGLAPRRHHVEQSPRKEILPVSPRSTSLGQNTAPLFRSLSSGSGESIDDGFMDLYDSDKLDEDPQLPSGIGFLLSGPLKDQNVTKTSSHVEQRSKPTFRRSLSLVETTTTAQISPQRMSTECLGSQNITPLSSEAARPFKRPEPPCGTISPLYTKRLKYLPLQAINENASISLCCSLEQKALSENAIERPTPVRLHRSFSETEATIKRALQRSTLEPDLIGDFSTTFVLPLMEGRHQDLKTISPDTLAKVMNEKFSDTVESYSIIDCRYPYEYNGGHIRGARNIYTKDQILKEFVDTQNAIPSTSSSSKRSILIFHCEFSSERGPSLSRFLRNSDRDQNKESYPALNYPEVYLLHGGYKNFYEQFSDMCEPCSYLPMLDPNHEGDLRHFRSKSKSWGGDSKNRLALRNNLKRLGL